MTLALEVTFADGRVFFPATHLSRIGGTFDGTLPAGAVRDADPAAPPPEIRTLSGETLFVSATQREDDLLEPFLSESWTSAPDGDQLGAALRRLHQAGLTSGEIDQIRARVGPPMTAYNSVYLDDFHLGLADLLDAATATRLPEHLRLELGEITNFYTWAMAIANRTGPQPAA